MSTPDERFQPEKIDEQIERLSRVPLAGNADAELIAYLRSVSRLDSTQERAALSRMWTRIADRASDIPQQPWKGTITPMYEQPTLRSNPPVQRPRRLRPGLLAAVLVMALLVGGLIAVLNAVHGIGNGPAGPGQKPAATVLVAPTKTPVATTVPTKTPVPLRVTSVTIAVSPSSISGMSCGTQVTVKYIVTIHAPADNRGGTVQLQYTVNNGRSSSPPVNVIFAPGQTTRTFTFTWSGPLPADHTYPGLGGVMIISPNTLNSQLIKPAGQCS